MDYRIDLLWDLDVCVWVATSKDVPGLVLESGSYDALIERVRFAVQELLELNGKKASVFGLIYTSKRYDKVSVNDCV